jgi:cell division protein FtsB
MAKRRRGRRPARTSILLRWLAVGVLVLVAFLYYRPLRTYISTRHELAQRRAEVQQLAAQKAALEARLAASTSLEALAREARRLGLVRPGEHLYIVKGIPAWRNARRATIAGHGR